MTLRTSCAGLLRRLAARIDPGETYLPGVVPDQPPSYASGRADLALNLGPRRRRPPWTGDLP